MDAKQVIELAKKYAPYAAMSGSAWLCINDAEQCLSKGARNPAIKDAMEASAKARALKSLAYSVGISSEVYKRAAE